MRNACAAQIGCGQTWGDSVRNDGESSRPRGSTPLRPQPGSGSGTAGACSDAKSSTKYGTSRTAQAPRRRPAELVSTAGMSARAPNLGARSWRDVGATCFHVGRRHALAADRAAFSPRSLLPSLLLQLLTLRELRHIHAEAQEVRWLHAAPLLLGRVPDR